MTEENKEEDWMKYANSGFGQTNYSLWDEVVEEEEEEEEEEEDEGAEAVVIPLATSLVQAAPVDRLKHVIGSFRGYLLPCYSGVVEVGLELYGQFVTFKSSPSPAVTTRGPGMNHNTPTRPKSFYKHPENHRNN